MRGKIELLTRKAIIADVPKRWSEQYYRYPADSDKAEIGRQLKGLKTRKEIDALIGNGSWTQLNCASCDSDPESVALLPATQEYGPEQYCLNCLKEAVKLLERGSDD